MGLLSSSAEFRNQKSPERIGDFLVRNGLLKQYLVNEVARAQYYGDSRRFGEIAQELGFIDDRAIARFLSHRDSQLGER